MEDPRKRTSMLPPWDEEEQIARSLKKYRRRFGYHERQREREEKYSYWNQRVKRPLIAIAIIFCVAIFSMLIRYI